MADPNNITYKSADNDRLHEFIAFCEINGMMASDTVKINMVGFGAEASIDVCLGELKKSLK